MGRGGSLLSPVLLLSLLIKMSCGLHSKATAFHAQRALFSHPRLRRRPHSLLLFSTQGDGLKAVSKVAIVGGGLAGLSTAYHLLEQSTNSNQQQHLKVSVTIFDPRVPGKAEASSVAGGLLHPLSPKNKLLWMGEEGFRETWKLVQASKAGLERREPGTSSQRLLSPPDSILRPALTQAHERDYQAAAQALPEWLTWMGAKEFSARVGVLEGRGAQQEAEGEGRYHYRGGLVLRKSVILSMPAYLRGLWWNLEDRYGKGGVGSVTWVEEHVGSVQELMTTYDVVVLASGAGLRGFEETACFQVDLVKGRTLLLSPEPPPPSQQAGDQLGVDGGLDAALLCGEYVVPGWDEGTGLRVLRCGATREYQPLNSKDFPQKEKEEMEEACMHAWKHGDDYDDDDDDVLRAFREKVRGMYPPSQWMETVKVTTGTRVATKRSNLGKLPIVGRLSSNGVDCGDGPLATQPSLWVFTGLGGRGLIHHAVLGRGLASSILHGDESFLPPEVLPGSRSTPRMPG